LASAEYRLGLDDLAQQHFQQAVQMAPLHGTALLGLARVLMRQAQHDRGLLDQALAAAQTAAKVAPDSADLHLTLARVHGFRGDIAASEQAYLQAMDGPLAATACRELTETHQFTAGDPLVPRIMALVGATPADRCHLGFARFKLHQDLGQPAEAFTALAEANRLRRAALRYDPAQDLQQFAALTLTAPSLARHTLTAPAASPRPIFILGMPRSGTSLVEQILSSHSDVAGGGELPFLSRALDLATGKQPASSAAVQQVRQDYLSRINVLAKDKAYVTDKMPHNFRLIPLIRAALPEALIVHVHRDPAAVCWSNYKHYFASPALGYCYDLADITRFHALYSGLMQRWSDLYGDSIIPLDYDALTRNPAAQIRALLAVLSLPWQDACLTPQHNKRAVRTVSQMQVIQPIHAGSSDDWRQYQPYLGGAFDGLT
ncbi:MAG: sulfotransferase, partial [Pseudorhodobacter sp.]|nr:sulfotransferase [Pseudorhodobacter sp.]